MKTYIIAEMAWAHDGSLEKAVKIMKAAKDSGANAIGIHITNLENYMVPYYGNGEGKVSAGREELDVYKYLVKINLSENDWAKFAAEAKEHNIDLCVMPNDMKALKFTADVIKPQSYVIPAASFVEPEFLKQVALQKKKTFFRIGGAYLGEIEQAINLFRRNGNNDVVLLHGVQMYPTKIEDTNIAILRNLQSIFNVEVGLADHIDGGSPLAKTIPLLAIPYGAKYIEKHITFNREEKGEDFESALNPSDFKEFVEFVRSSEAAAGTEYYRDLDDANIRYRNVTRKKIVANNQIKEGHAVEMKDVSFKRCDIGLTPDKIDYILGRKTNKNIDTDEVITLEKLI